MQAPDDDEAPAGVAAPAAQPPEGTDPGSPDIVDSFAACLSSTRAPQAPAVPSSAPNDRRKRPAQQPADGGGEKKRKRVGDQRRCGKCKACMLSDDCGTCSACLDKPRFGGPNSKKQRCHERRCLSPNPVDGEPAARKPAAKSETKMGSPKPQAPPKLTPSACILPKTYKVAMRRPDFPPWALGEGPGPMSKSMVMAERGYPTRASGMEGEVEAGDEREDAVDTVDTKPEDAKLEQQEQEEEPLTEEEARAKAEEEEKEKAEERAALAAAWDRTSIPAPKDGAKDTWSGIEAGMGADVEMTEEGLIGSRYSATVRGLRPAPDGKRKPKEALVEYDTLFDEADEDVQVGEGEGAPRRLQEWVPIVSLHAVPPRPPDGWLSRVRPGDVLDALYEGGWWTVIVKACPADAGCDGGEGTATAMKTVAAATEEACEEEEGEDKSAEGVADADADAVLQPSSASQTVGAAVMGKFKTEVKGYGIEREFCALDLRPCLGSRLLQVES